MATLIMTAKLNGPQAWLADVCPHRQHPARSAQCAAALGMEENPRSVCGLIGPPRQANTPRPSPDGYCPADKLPVHSLESTGVGGNPPYTAVDRPKTKFGQTTRVRLFVLDYPRLWSTSDGSNSSFWISAKS